jgi:hypothetical protein
MPPLTAAAILTRPEMILVVAPQFRGNTGNVVPPAGQDGPYNMVIAGGVSLSG